jgi:hypothetical protein
MAPLSLLLATLRSTTPPTNGVGAEFQCLTTASNQAMIRAKSVGCYPSNAGRLRIL